MTDGELIEKIAKAICYGAGFDASENVIARGTGEPVDLWTIFLPDARAALTVAKREIVERCANAAESCDRTMHPADVARWIREMNDDR